MLNGAEEVVLEGILADLAVHLSELSSLAKRSSDDADVHPEAENGLFAIRNAADERARTYARAVNYRPDDTLLDLVAAAARELRLFSARYDSIVMATTLPPGLTLAEYLHFRQRQEHSAAEADAEVEKIATQEDFRGAIGASAYLAVEKLTELTPSQKLGPVAFEVQDDVLRVRHQPAATAEARAASVESARAELRTVAKALVAEMEGGNVAYERALVEMVRDLGKRIDNKVDVVQIGLAAIPFQKTIEALKRELPDIMAGRLEGFAIQVSMYAAQFPEWAEFSDQAAEMAFEPADMPLVQQATTGLADRLAEAKQVVDDEVPRTIAWLAEAARNPPARTARRVGYAAVVSLQNLTSAFVKYIGMNFAAFSEGTQDGSKIAGKVTVLLGLVATIHALEPIIGAIPQLAWLVAAAPLLQRAAQGD